MINNIIEIWYWTIMLAAFIGVIGYFGYCSVMDSWAELKARRNQAQAPQSPEQIMLPYSKRIVIIHWLTLLLLIIAWYLGEVLVDARSETSATLTGYLVHSLLGGLVLLLTILRLVFRSVDGTPPPVGNSLMDMAARGVQNGIYFFLVLLAVSGFMTLLTSSVGEALLAGNEKLLPTKYSGPGLIPHAMHEILVTVMIVVIVMHILGAIKHQFIMKDGLMRRMSLRGKVRRPH